MNDLKNAKRKGPWIVTNCEIITPREYLKKKEQEEKDKEEALHRQKEAASKKNSKEK